MNRPRNARVQILVDVYVNDVGTIQEKNYCYTKIADHICSLVFYILIKFHYITPIYIS